MRCTAAVVCVLGSLSAVLAQAPVGPVINPRGVINAFSQQPAPSTAAPGAIIHIRGLNLGPPEGVKAGGTPLPTRLGDPPIEVLISGRPVPLFSASPERIVAQVPWAASTGLAAVVVRRGGAESRPARILINRAEPAIRTVGDKGFGEVAGTLSGQTLTIAAAGLGPTQPRVGAGEPGPQDPPAKPRDEVQAYIGGLPANVTAALSTERVGEFDIRIEVPPAAQPGDIVTLTAGGRPANRATFQKLFSPEVRFVALPEGAPELRGLVGADLRGSFLIGAGPRGDDGCYPSYLFDLSKPQAGKIDACLTTGNRNARSPVVASTGGSALAALVGPPLGEPPSGISSQVMIFQPGGDQPLTVDLPAPAVTLGGGAGGDFSANLGGGPPARLLLIDAQTGEIREPGPETQGGGTATPAGALNPEIDLGDGLTHVLVVVALPQSLFAAIVADSNDQPTKARIALLNRQGEVQTSGDFPEGWLPLVAPLPPERPNAPAAAGDRIAPGLAARRIFARFDNQQQTFYVLARQSDNSRHGLVAFIAEQGTLSVINFPDSWFAAACSPSIPVFTLELSRKLVFLASRAAETGYKDPCPGVGFVLLDLDNRSLAAVQLPGQDQFDADTGASGDINDHIYGSNTDPSRRNMADALFVLDGVTGSAFRLGLPTGITSFANLVRVPEMNALIGLAANRQPGDAGFVYFDLERAEARILPVPEGFAQVNLMGVFTATRKLVARGIKAGGAGSQYLIYDLVTDDLAIVQNPDGVVAVGGVVGQPAPGVLQSANPKANTIAAVGYNGEGKQAGVLVVRVP